MRRNQEGLSLLGIVIAAAVVGLLYFFVVRVYMNNPSTVSDEAQQLLEEQGVNTSQVNYAVKKAKQAAHKAEETSRKFQKEVNRSVEGL